MNKIFTFIFLVGLLQSCSKEELTTKERYESELDTLYKEVKLVIDGGNCDDLSDCKTMPIGDKPCGGPSGYLIYSSDVDYLKLQGIVSRYTQLQKKYNEEFGILSDCAMVNPPEVIGCINSKCGRAMN